MIQQVVDYFSHIRNADRTLILVGGLLLFWIIEGVIPLYKFNYHKLKHAGPNLLLTLTTIVVNFLFALLIVKSSDWTVAKGFGLLHIFKLPLWASLVAGLLLLDLIGAYLIHFIEHKIKFLWKFHMVHHSDTYVDATTANRHHPGESVFRALFTLIGVILCGAPMWLVILYQSLSALVSQFTHANLRLPEKIDKGLSYFLVSPNMHKVHHHYVRPQTDSNFGNIFSVWDRLFGTYNYTPASQLKYGLDVLDDSTSSHLGYQFKIPFNRTIKTDY